MPRQINTQVENSFIGGLITEATALNFPANACTDTDNCVFNTKGNVTRRFGLDYETGYSVNPVDRSNAAFTAFLWPNAGGNAGVNFQVLQVGPKLYFYQYGANNSLSSQLKGTVDLSSLKTDTQLNLDCNEVQLAYGQGYLFGVHPYCEPFSVTYTPGSPPTFSLGQINIKVRDTDGIVDETGYDYDERPTALTDKHRYNLYNQGWFPTSTNDYIKSWQTATQVLLPLNTAPYFLWVTVTPARTDYPSNADVWWMFKNASDQFDIALAETNKRGNTPAPKGYFVMSAWNMDRTTASIITKGSTKAGGGISTSDPVGTVYTLTGIPSTTSGVHRPSTIAFFAGRVFYSGVNTEGYSNKIYFSQVIKNPEHFGRCYQLNDPTNGELFEMLATDGGVVTIPDAGQILKFFSVQNSLLVFATNGVWIISGNTGVGFTAGDYTIRKVSSIPAISASSFVDVEGLPIWWNYDGIYRISEMNAAGGAKIDSLTQSTIRTYYNEKIPAANKAYAKGAYSPVTKEVKWVFRSDNATAVHENYEYDRCLTLNTLTGAFFPWSFSHDAVKVVGLTCLSTQETIRVTIPSMTVSGGVSTANLTSNGNQIYERKQTTQLSAGVFKFITVSGSLPSLFDLTFAETLDPTYVDFKTETTTGVSYSSYFVTGYKAASSETLTGSRSLLGRKFQSNYVTMFLKYEDDPALYLQAAWNFGRDSDSGSLGSNQLLQFPPANFSTTATLVNTSNPTSDYVAKKVKVRGSGKALQLRFSSVDGRPFDLSGWSRWETANPGI